MNPSTKRVSAYYATHDEWSRLASPAGQLELRRALEVVAAHVAPGGRVLDLGGGPGRYTIELLRRGFQVVLADLSPEQLAVAERRLLEAGLGASEVRQADACDLGAWREGCFDAVLAFGPFYHLVESERRGAAAAEIHRVLRSGGVLLAAIQPRLSGLRGILERAVYAPGHVASETLERVAARGVFRNESAAGFQEGWYPELAEVDALFGAAGFEKVRCVSLRGLMAGREAQLLAMETVNPEAFSAAMELLRRTAERPAVVELGDHALWVGRKAAEPREG